MRKKNTRSYFLLFVMFLFLMSFSRQTNEALKGSSSATLGSIWEHLTSLRLSIKPLLGWVSGRSSSKLQEEVKELKLKNQALMAELNHVKELYQRERYCQMRAYQQQKLGSDAQDFTHDLLNFEFNAIAAQVIYRPPTLWNNSIWINVGKKSYPTKGIVAKNSPVIVGSSLVGVIDYVGQNQSRVRLITDPGLTPSVRAARGQIQDRLFAERLWNVLQQIPYYKSVLSAEELKVLTSFYEKTMKNFELSNQSWFLAKGELQGTSQLLWRKPSYLLKGIGFNYDFDDDQGPARDLRTGCLQTNQSDPISLLKVNDLLVTTGMDGVFPPGLHVAQVTKIYPLKEGDYYYEIEAKTTAENLEDLSTVYVIAPYGFDEKDQPSL